MVSIGKTTESDTLVGKLEKEGYIHKTTEKVPTPADVKVFVCTGCGNKNPNMKQFTDILGHRFCSRCNPVALKTHIEETVKDLHRIHRDKIAEVLGV